MNSQSIDEKKEFLHHSVTLSISSPNLKCSEIAMYLKKSKIMGNVTSNNSIICQGKTCTLEHGCSILLNQISKNSLENNVWKPIKKDNKLNCGHLNIPGSFSGCIYDFIRDTDCPNFLKKS